MSATAGATRRMGKKDKAKGKIKEREHMLPAELRRAVRNERLTKERALRLVDGDGEFSEPEIPNPDKPASNVVVLRVNEVVIDWLLKRRHITNSQWGAAHLLRNHFECSGLEQLRAMDPTKDIVDGGQNKPEPLFREKHLNEFNHAIRQLGPWTYSVVSDVVLRDVKPEQASVSGMYKDKQRKGVEALTVLRMGLSTLAGHWKLPKDWQK